MVSERFVLRPSTSIISVKQNEKRGQSFSVTKANRHRGFSGISSGQETDAAYLSSSLPAPNCTAGAPELKGQVEWHSDLNWSLNHRITLLDQAPVSWNVSDRMG